MTFAQALKQDLRKVNLQFWELKHFDRRTDQHFPIMGSLYSNITKYNGLHGVSSKLIVAQLNKKCLVYMKPQGSLMDSQTRLGTLS
jgi:hypothetical protein